ncbi:unnamed protein product, partial [marine sediment metagenome]
LMQSEQELIRIVRCRSFRYTRKVRRNTHSGKKAKEGGENVNYTGR